MYAGLTNLCQVVSDLAFCNYSKHLLHIVLKINFFFKAIKNSDNKIFWITIHKHRIIIKMNCYIGAFALNQLFGL